MRKFTTFLASSWDSSLPATWPVSGTTADLSSLFGETNCSLFSSAFYIEMQEYSTVFAKMARLKWNSVKKYIKVKWLQVPALLHLMVFPRYRKWQHVQLQLLYHLQPCPWKNPLTKLGMWELKENNFYYARPGHSHQDIKLVRAEKHP